MTRFARTAGLTALVALVGGGLFAPTADANTHAHGVPFESMKSFVEDHGIAAVQKLNPDLSSTEVAELAADPTVHITPSGIPVVVEAQISTSLVSSSPSSITSSRTNIPLDDFQSLNSRPGSNHTIFLDFDGHTVPTDTAWDYEGFGYPTIAGDYPPFSVDGSPSFSNSEKQIIIDAWLAVAEDYAMFDVNVTTQDPGEDALERVDNTDLTFGTRALITPGNSSWNPSTCRCGGIAMLGVFDLSADLGYGDHWQYQPAFAFAQSNSDGKFISDVVSHEVGHNFGLSHDGNFRDVNGNGRWDENLGEDWTEYFDGFQDDKNWATIMGAGYYNGLVQWSQNDYAYPGNPGTNVRQNDTTVIAQNGAPFIADEPGTNTSTARVISSTPIDGVIGTRTDVDWFKVTVSDGSLGIHSYSPTVDSNLDTKLTLTDGRGVAIFSTDAPSDMSEAGNGDGTWPVSGLDGVMNVTLPNGTYYVTLDGVGRSGAYSDYGSLGQYSIETRARTAASIATIGTPTISGTRRKGYKLTANYGTWSSGTSFTKRWLRDGVAIKGATKKSYTLTSADVGHKISVRIVGTKSGKSAAIKVSSKTKKITN